MSFITPNFATVKIEALDDDIAGDSAASDSGTATTPLGQTINVSNFSAPIEEEEEESVSYVPSDPFAVVNCELSLMGFDLDELRQMKALDLPTSFTATIEPIRKQIKTYFCEICLLHLNSKETMKSHVKGAKHMKKALSERRKWEEALLTNGELQVPVEKVIRQIFADPASPPPSKKVPIRLAEKLRKIADPVVGLSFVRETIACSSRYAEPFYECLLCGSEGSSIGMYNHLLGRGHRERFLQNRFPGDPNYLDISEEQLLSDVSRLCENDNLGVIQTILSDELYPWPAKKAPWSLEKGGTGKAPTGSLAVRRKNQEDILRAGCTNVKWWRPVSVLDLNPDNLKDVKDRKQLDHYFQLANAVLKRVTEFRELNCAAKSKDELQTWHKIVSLNLKVTCNIPDLQKCDPSGCFNFSLPLPRPASSHHVTHSRSPQPFKRKRSPEKTESTSRHHDRYSPNYVHGQREEWWSSSEKHYRRY